MFDVREIPEVTPEDIDLELIKENDFVIFRTGRIESYSYVGPKYFENHPQLSHDLKKKLAEKKIRFIGVDCPGIRQDNQHEKADRFCEQHGIYVIENLRNLSKIPAKRFIVYTMWLDDEIMTGLKYRVILECKDEN